MSGDGLWWTGFRCIVDVEWGGFWIEVLFMVFFVWFFDIDPPFAWLGWSLLREGMKLFGEWNFLEEKFVRGREVTKHERGERGRRKEWWKIRVAGMFFYVFVWFFLFFLSFHFILFCWIFKMTVQNGVSPIVITFSIGLLTYFVNHDLFNHIWWSQSIIL